MSVDENAYTRKCVLLVEDDISQADQLDELLGRLGFEDVLFADDLQDAEEIAKTAAFDVALLDVNLRNGFQTVVLGHTLARQGVRVLFMSGYNAEEMSQATRGFEFVEKPLSLSRLKAALMRAFVRTPAVSSQRAVDRLAS